MLEMLPIIAGVFAYLGFSWYKGAQKKANVLARVKAEPKIVERLFLRRAVDIDTYWLHIELKTGKKFRVAAPWDVDAVLPELEAVGLHLSESDYELLRDKRKRDEAVARAEDAAAASQAERESRLPANLAKG